MSEYRAHARWDMLRRHLDMYVGVEHGAGIVTFHGPGGQREDVAPELEPPADVLWRVPAGAAHAIINALSREVGLADSAKFLRADFEHERGRVDLLIDNLIAPAP